MFSTADSHKYLLCNFFLLVVIHEIQACKTIYDVPVSVKNCFKGLGIPLFNLTDSINHTARSKKIISVL